MRSRLTDPEDLYMVALMLIGVYQSVFHLTTGQYWAACFFGLGIAFVAKSMLVPRANQAFKLVALIISWVGFSISAFNTTTTDPSPWLFVLQAIV